MRNLKRVLSLGLATVMLLGMMVLGTSAADKTFADLTDSDQIVNKEAVSVLVDLGIVEGTDTGAYQPTLTVNRATMAKFVYCLLNGVDDKGALFADMDLGFSDIDTPSASWAKGYINYCASMGIISGDGNGHFYPDVEVSTVQAAKMLLVALGYNADASKYQNDANWAVNVMRDAQKSGIVARSMSANAGLSRDNTALLVFNTLSAKTVTPEYAFTVNGDRYVSKYSNNDTTLGYESYGLIKITAKVDSIDSNGIAVLTDKKYNGNTAVNITTKIPGDASMVGNTVAFYVKGTVTNNSGTITITPEKVYSSTLLPSATNVVYTGMDGTSLSDLTTRGNKKFVAELDDTNPVTYYLNGQSSNSTDVAAAVSLSGVIVELIDTKNDGKVDVVRATKKTVATVSAEPSFRTQNDEEQVRIPGVVSAWTSVDKVEGYDGLEKGDVVLAYNDGAKIYIEKAESMEAVADGYHSTKGLQVGVDYYGESGLVSAGSVFSGSTWTNFKDTYIFYLDNAQNIVKAVKSDSNTTTESTYAVVRQVAWFPGSGFNTNGHMEAKLLFTDGTMKTVTISSVDGFVPVSAGSTVKSLYSSAGFASTDINSLSAAVGTTAVGTTAVDPNNTKVQVKNFTVAAKDNNAKPDRKYYGVSETGDLTDSTAKYIVLDQFYEYTESNGNYSLKNVASADALENSPIYKGAAKFNGTSGATGNANTVFLFDKGVDKTPDIYVGIAEVPNASAPENHTNGNTVVLKDNVAQFVFVKGVTATGDTSSDVVYIADPSFTSTSAGKVVNAFINGEPGTITLASDVTPTAGLYRVESVSDKGVSTLSTTNLPAVATGIKTNSGNTLVLGNNDARSYDDNTEVFVISVSDGEATVTQIGASDIELDGNDNVYAFVDSQVSRDYAYSIYVIKNETVAPTVTLATASSNAATDVVDFAAGTNKGSAKFATNADKVKVTVTHTGTATANFDITIALSGAPATDNDNYTSGDDIQLTAAGTLTVTVTLTDKFSNAVETYRYTVEVTAA